MALLGGQGEPKFITSVKLTTCRVKKHQVPKLQGRAFSQQHNLFCQQGATLNQLSSYILWALIGQKVIFVKDMNLLLKF